MGTKEALKHLGHLEPKDKQKFRWEELKIRIDTYKYYLTLTLQANAFFYATTGVVLGFYLKEPEKQSANLKYILLLPILIGTVLGTIFLFAAKLQTEAAKSIDNILTEFRNLGLQVEEIPDINLLYLLLQASGWLSLLVSVLLISVPLIGASTSIFDILRFIVIAVLLLGGGIWRTHRFAREIDKTRNKLVAPEEG